MDSLLFHGHHLSEVLAARTHKMKSEIADTPTEQINGATDDQLVDHFVSQYHIEPLTVYVDRAEAQHRETKVDVSHDSFRRFIPEDRGPFFVKGDEITVHAPFTGDPNLFKVQPSRGYTSAPRGEVHQNDQLAGTVTCTLALPSDVNDERQFNDWIKQQLGMLESYTGWIRNDLVSFHQSLPSIARDAVKERRQQLEKHGALSQKLCIPVRPRSDAPAPTPIPMPKKVIKPLPPPRKVEQEYGISDGDFEYILTIIRQESRSFESTPTTFAKLDEEELRNVVLAHLNGHFEGGAAGERFRKHGKTDICIEHANRAAFVAECKVWSGPKALADAIDQLLGYLTWRDIRTALIVWNKDVKDFAKLQVGMPGCLSGHPGFIRHAAAGHAGEWRALFRSTSDEGREIIVHVFLVDLSVV